MDATTCQYDCSYLAMDFLLLLVVLKSPGYLLLPLSAMFHLSVSPIPLPAQMIPTLTHALYAFHTSPHLSSYSFALALLRCATQSCSGILSGRGPGVKYDSSHALKHESYSTFKGVHSLLRLCDICPSSRQWGGSRDCFVLVQRKIQLQSAYCILKVFVVRTTLSPLSFEAQGCAHIRLNAGNGQCFQKITKNSKCVGIESSQRHLEEDSPYAPSAWYLWLRSLIGSGDTVNDGRKKICDG